MTGRELATLLEGGDFFEGPRWHDGRWWVSDMHQRLVRAIEPDGAVEEVLTVEGRPSGLGWLPDGSLLVVSMNDRRVLRRAPDGGVATHADIAEHCGGNANDMVVDEHGRAWVGNFGFDYEQEEPRPTAIVRVDPDGSASVAADGLFFPNGMVIGDDGATLAIGETFASRYTAFTIGGDGELSERRVWAQLGSEAEPYFPDGCCLDAEGCIWSADARSSRCGRIAPGGAVVDEVHVPAGLRCYACMLGGDDGRTLLLCAAPDSSAANRAGAREAVLFTTTVDVPHAGLP
jgi:sugar lactone lactonase YvrE